MVSKEHRLMMRRKSSLARYHRIKSDPVKYAEHLAKRRDYDLNRGGKGRQREYQRRYRKTDKYRAARRKRFRQPHLKARRAVRNRNWRLQKYYGITQQAYLEMVQSQGGLCLICRDGNKELVIDHSHKTGKVRGLLCNSCNRALGMLQDNPAIAEEAVMYLIKHSA